VPLPADPYPLVEFVKVNVSGEYQQAGCDQVFASPRRSGEPATGDSSGALDADIVTTLSDLAEVIDQGLKYWAFGGQQCLAMEGCGDLT
jgi:hypothetical protein